MGASKASPGVVVTMEGSLDQPEMLGRTPSALDLGRVYFSCPGTDLGYMVSQGQSRAEQHLLALDPPNSASSPGYSDLPREDLQETQPGTSEVCRWYPHQFSMSPEPGRSSWTLIQRAWRTPREQLSLGGPVLFVSYSLAPRELGGVSNPAF